MSLLVEASAVIAGEPEQERLATAMRNEERLLWSAVVALEAISGPRSSHRWPVAAAPDEVGLIVSRLPFQLVPIGGARCAAALDAHQRYGKGTGHRARPNMGDCFAYARAKGNHADLLYEDSDSTHTDLARGSST